MGRNQESKKALVVLQSPQKKSSWKRRTPAVNTGTAAAVSLKDINQLKEQGKQTHLKAARTRTAYATHVRRGRDNPEFRTAFESTPNSCSDKALALYMTWKGFHENLGKSTVESIRAAFKDVWANADGNTFRGKWGFNEARQRWEGNPAESADVQDVLTSIKHKASAEAGDRKHSLPITQDHLDRMLQWARTVCPDLDFALSVLRMTFSTPGSGPAQQPLSELLGLKVRTLVTRHLEQLAFASTAWTLWTRCYELIRLKRRHITIDCTMVDRTLEKSVYFEVYLANRKGWQRKVDKGMTEADLRSNRYKIFPQPELPGADCFLWLPLWVHWLERVHYQQPLDPDDNVFPAMGANGVVQPREPISHDTVQQWINEATTGAGIQGSFSTHCFRRGGAQYRFMLAPVGERWSLKKVHWWGGWAEGEHHNTLIRYLLDKLYCYETDYSDALAPIVQDVRDSLVGESALMQPVTAEEVRTAHASITSNVRGLWTRMGQVSESVHELATVIRQGMAGALWQPWAGSTTHGSYASVVHSVAPPSQSQLLHGHPSSIAPTPVPQLAQASAPVPPVGPMARVAANHVVTAGAGPSQTASFHDYPVVPLAKQPPLSGLRIPNIPVELPDGSRRPRRDSWRDIIAHWLVGDPPRGLSVPLKDWPADWYQGRNRTFASKYSQRATTALEFIDIFKSDEARFLAAYPEAEEGHTHLLHAINRARRERRQLESQA
ncbi:hypothetical protein BKA82DRAFT_3986196 [Pisolithus tinctorius]|nr:hypothetical protein BKA82DRAFT_3986196 [Pisolithus tinctorius]